MGEGWGEGLRSIDRPQPLTRIASGDAIRPLPQANHLRHGSEMLEQFIQKDRLLVVGAEYSLETGEVDFFDGMPGVG